MKRFFDNKIAFAAILFLFTCALTWNMVHGRQFFSSSHLQALPGIVNGQALMHDGKAVRIAHGPTMPPDGGAIRTV